MPDDPAELKRRLSILKRAIKTATRYAARSLPPDGITAQEAISGVLGALDNDEVIEALEG